MAAIFYRDSEVLQGIIFKTVYVTYLAIVVENERRYAFFELFCQCVHFDCQLGAIIVGINL